MSEAVANLWLEDLVGEAVGLKIRVRQCLASHVSPFQRIAVYDSQAFGKMLVLGSELALTDNDADQYSQGLVHGTVQTHPDPKRVLILGGGDGSLCREVCRYQPVESVTVVEIDQALVDVCREHFPAFTTSFDDPRVHLVIDDAHRFLHETDQQWDVVLLDAFELRNPASEAFQPASIATSLLSVMADGSVLAAPLGSAAWGGERSRGAFQNLRVYFPDARVFQIDTPSIAGGSFLAAWASRGQDVFTLHHATEPWVDHLAWWDADVHKARFVLAKGFRSSVGL